MRCRKILFIQLVTGQSRQLRIEAYNIIGGWYCNMTMKLSIKYVTLQGEGKRWGRPESMQWPG